MNNEELKKKIVEALKNTVIGYDCGHAIIAKNFYAERVFERFTDALIAAGIGDVNATKEKLEGYYYFEVAREKQRAERAKRALINEIKSRIKMTGDNASLVYVYYGHAINQAEKELAEERKDE